MTHSISPRAAAEIRAAARRYEGLRPSYGRRFIQEVERTVSRLSQFPGAAQGVGLSFRRAVLHRFPYCILYRQDGAHVEIIAVLAMAMDPERMHGRMSRPARPTPST